MSTRWCSGLMSQDRESGAGKKFEENFQKEAAAKHLNNKRKRKAPKTRTITATNDLDTDSESDEDLSVETGVEAVPFATASTYIDLEEVDWNIMIPATIKST